MCLIKRSCIGWHVLELYFENFSEIDFLVVSDRGDNTRQYCTWLWTKFRQTISFTKLLNLVLRGYLKSPFYISVITNFLKIAICLYSPRHYCTWPWTKFRQTISFTKLFHLVPRYTKKSLQPYSMVEEIVCRNFVQGQVQ